MPIEYRIDPETGVIFRHFTGDVTMLEFEWHWRALLSDTALPEPIVLLADMRDCRLQVHGGEISRLVTDVIAPRLRERRWFPAIVVGTPVQYGISKQIIAYSHGCGVTDVFYNTDEALAWLRAEIAPASSDHLDNNF